LFGLLAIHISEELDALDRRDRIVRRRRYGRLAACFPGSDGAALQKIQFSILDRPFDVPPRALHLFALKGKFR
jgi:hypothetical protein